MKRIALSVLTLLFSVGVVPTIRQACAQPSPSIEQEYAMTLENYPPFVAAPVEATPVIVTVELVAEDPQALEQHLNSAAVIPTTRLASGINYSWTVRDANDANRFVLIQQWNSAEQQQAYIGWRSERGDLEELRSLLTQDPVVTYLTPVDLNNLPVQASN